MLLYRNRVTGKKKTPQAFETRAIRDDTYTMGDSRAHGGCVAKGRRGVIIAVIFEDDHQQTAVCFFSCTK